jgi:hypothetical protein
MLRHRGSVPLTQADDVPNGTRIPTPHAARPGREETRMIVIGFASIGSTLVGGFLAASNARVPWRVFGGALMLLGLTLGCVYGPMP